MDWTEEQKKAIYEKDSNILVAAAAGSGKTAVLVERIIQKIIKDQIDIDKLLVVTFTNAAASEMRERVLEAIYKKIDEEPENQRLQKQIILLGKASICTIHSFCLDVIRNNFFELNIPANVRIGSEQEIMLLKVEVLENLFEKLYEDGDEDFEELVNTYTNYRNDDYLKDLVLNIYRFIQSMPFPKEWLLDNIEKFKTTDDTNDFAQSIWAKVIINNIKDEVEYGIRSLMQMKNRLEMVYELDKFKMLLEEDINTLKGLYDSLDKTWDDIVKYVNLMSFSSWPRSRENMELKDEAKKVRDNVISKFKNGQQSIIKGLFDYNSEMIYSDFDAIYEILKKIGNLVIAFDESFQSTKREKNIIDFNDIEHFALKILLSRDADGNYVPSKVAEKYRDKFEEIAIDEYQDSNQVQEYILSTISRGNNIFMVGDVKQSIYKFRQACPKLFLDKYNSYTANGSNSNGKKIQLFKNFRSKKNVLDVTNLVFENIMTSSLGDNVEYTKEEFLNLGASFEDYDNMLDNAELNIIELDDELDSSIDNKQVEARFVANKIKELIKNKYIVSDRNGGHEIRYKDIVILLRSTSTVAPIFEKELIDNDIPVFSDATNEYIDTIEIQTIVNILKIIDNPLDDIAIVSGMRSTIGGFTDNEILEIRLINRDCSFYESLKLAKEKLNGTILEKINTFMDRISKWRKESDYISMAELIWEICLETGFYNYVGLMPNGSLRQANLKLLFEIAKDYEKTSYAGIYNFIRYIERLKSENSDMSAAKIIGENEDVVRIMSIHKSKGLEFPVVILANMAKKINFQDLSSKIILHQELGFGPEYINYKTMQEYPIIAKDAIKIISREETIAEEMRVLYVALTRAKEKLIMVGISKDISDELEKKSEALSVYKTESKINRALLKKYVSYLDWIELVYLNNKHIVENEDMIKLNKIIASSVFQDNNEEKEEDSISLNFDEYTKFDDLKEMLEWEYSYEDTTKLPIKSTVSKIKEKSISGSDINTETKLEELIPSFMKDEEKGVSGSQRGTLMHMVLQKIDFSREYSLDDIDSIKNDMLAKDIINQAEYDSIDSHKIYDFIHSNLGREIAVCKVVYKEKPFCIKVDAKESFEGISSDNTSILVQGIIDLYAIKQDGSIILVDYKTDYVKDENELIDKYYKQLELYKMALEKAYDKKVESTYIYSLYLGKEIRL